jgi:hypothetical protein
MSSDLTQENDVQGISPQSLEDITGDSRGAKQQLLTTFILSLTYHLLIFLILLLFSNQLDLNEGKELFLRLGESEKPVGELLSSNLIEDPLSLPNLDVTRMEPADLPPQVTPDLPRLLIPDVAGIASEDLTTSSRLEGFGITQFDGESEKIQGVSVKVGDPQFTLIWDSQADLDLHVLEPGGSEISWESRKGKKGGELDVDDVDGIGPENIYWKLGAGPRGEFVWWVHYYGGLQGKQQRTHWQVRIKRQGQVEVIKGTLSHVDEYSKKYSFQLK